MIFNPLFLNENSSSQIISSKTNKLSNNKYLFSDIVKVVMNPIGEQKKLPTKSEEMIDNRIGLSLENGHSPIQLKLKFLSDIDNEKARLSLAEILPDEISQLLVNNESISNIDKAISYISKDLLSGELQNFVNNLVGTELIEKSISDESGLLLSLEDKNSAVNLELAKDNKVKSSRKISVQAVIVPEKSKLFSIIDGSSSGNSIMKINKAYSVQLNRSSEDVKPTLSVFSYKYDGDDFESLTKTIKANHINKHNLNFILNDKMSHAKTQKTPLEKISFVPKNIKQENLKDSQATTRENPKLNQHSSDLKIVKHNTLDKMKDFSVNKITIVKKNGEVLKPNNIINNSETSSKELDTALKRIDFGNKTKIKNNKTTHASEIKIVNEGIQKNKKNVINQKDSKSIKQSNIESNKQNLVPENKSRNNIPIKGEIKSHNEKIIQNDKETTLKMLKAISPEIKKQNQGTKTNLDFKSDKAASEINSIRQSKSQVSNKNKTGNYVETDKINKIIVEKDLDNLKPPVNIKYESKIPSKNINTMEKKYNSKTDPGQLTTNNEENDLNKKVIKQIDNNTLKEFKNIGSTKPNKNDSELTISNRSSKSKNFSKEINKDYESSKEISSKSTINNNLTDTKSDIKNSNNELYSKNLNPKKDMAEINETIVNASQKSNETAVNIFDNLKKPTSNNKKISVKVKEGIKSVTDKNQSSTNIVNQSEVTDNTANSEHSNRKGDNSNSMTNDLLNSTQFNAKIDQENSFDDIFSRHEINKLSGESKTPIETTIKSPSKIVESIEIVKELSKFISKQEKGSLEFNIRPKHLGQMKITIDTTDHALKAKIEVDNEQAKQLLERNLDKLQDELNENGVKLNSLNISLGNSKQQKEEKQLTGNNQNDSENQGQMGESEETEQKKSLGYNTYEYIA